jgi:hypothetical protein
MKPTYEPSASPSTSVDWVESVAVVTFKSHIVFYGMCLNDMDEAVQLAFRELVSNSMTNVSVDDILISSIINIACANVRSFVATTISNQTLAKNSVQVVFNTSVSTSGESNMTIVVDFYAKEITTSLSSPEFAKELVNKSVEYGSETLSKDTTLFTDVPEVSRSYTVSYVQTGKPSSQPTYWPTTSPSQTPLSIPTLVPSYVPSGVPVSFPTTNPSACPSAIPLSVPSHLPSLPPSDTPTSLPTIMPSLVPTSKDTRFPTPSPTSTPTSQPTNFFSHFDISTVFDETVASISDDVSFFELYIDSSRGDYVSGSSSWQNFLTDNFVDSTFDLDYFSITISSAFLQVGAIKPPQVYVSSCSDSTVTNAIISDLITGGVDTNTYVCDGALWEVSGMAMCVNCSTITPDMCPGAYSHVLSPNISACPKSIIDAAKYGSVVEVSSKLIIPDSVPVIRNMTLLPSLDSIIVSFTVTTSGYGGKTYCAAFGTDVKLGSNFAIREKGFSISTPRLEVFIEGEESQNVVITDLTPATFYNVYCFTEDSYGNQLSLATVKGLGQNVTTSCCRRVEFTNIPMSVNGDFSIYSSSFDSDSYQIKIQVLDSPSDILHVTPILHHVNGTKYDGGNIAFIPTNVSFSSIQTDLSTQFGFFIVHATADAGVYSLELAIDGPGATDFAVDSGSYSNLEIILATPVPDPPTLKWARFSNSGNTIYVKFSAPVDLVRFSKSVTSQSWSCEKLIDFPGASLSKCSWTNSTFLAISSTSTSVVQPNDVIRLQQPVVAGKLAVYAFCIEADGDCSTYKASGNDTAVVISYPKSPITPTPSMLVPSAIGRCDDLTIDFSLSTGHGGRIWKNIHWIITSNDGSSVSTIASTLRAIDVASNDGTITIPAALIEESHLANAATSSNISLTSSTIYVISLGLENYLQNLSSSEIFYQNKAVTIDRSSNAPPKVTVIGSASRVVQEGKAITLNAKGVPSTCLANATTTTNTLTYKWKVYSEFILVSTLSSFNIAVNPKYFTLPAGVLSPGKTYQVAVTATDVYSAKSTDFVTIYVQPKPVSVHVPGGVNRQIPAQQSLTLDIEGSESGLLYTWTCFYHTLSTKYGTSCDSVVRHCDTNGTATASTSCKIAALTIVVDEVMLFTVTASSATSTGSAQILVTVTQPISSAQVEVISTYSGGKFNPNSKLQLNCSVSASVGVVTANWSLVDSAYRSLTDVGVSLTQLSRSFVFTDASPNIVQVY